jgi:thiol-disulfide isomerase/thioredoxin
MAQIARRALLFVVVSAMAAAAGYWVAKSSRAPAETATGVVEFTLPDLDNRPQAVSQWRGKLVLVNFWATWCPPCREEIPLFVEFQRQYAARGLQIVGVAIDQRGPVSEFARREGMNYPQLLGGDTGLALMAELGNRTGSLPYSVVLAPDGSVSGRKLGAYQRGELESLIKQLPAATSAK